MYGECHVLINFFHRACKEFSVMSITLFCWKYTWCIETAPNSGGVCLVNVKCLNLKGTTFLDVFVPSTMVDIFASLQVRRSYILLWNSVYSAGDVTFLYIDSCRQSPGWENGWVELQMAGHTMHELSPKRGWRMDLKHVVLLEISSGVSLFLWMDTETRYYNLCRKRVVWWCIYKDKLTWRS